MSDKLSDATIKSIIEEISSKTIDDKFFLQPLTKVSITENFSCLTESESYIIRAREGLLTGKKMTLEWLLGFTMVSQESESGSSNSNSGVNFETPFTPPPFLEL